MGIFQKLVWIWMNMSRNYSETDGAYVTEEKKGELR